VGVLQSKGAAKDMGVVLASGVICRRRKHMGFPPKYPPKLPLPKVIIQPMKQGGIKIYKLGPKKKK
jgi:hypothetical protein